MSEVEIKADRFFEHYQQLLSKWENYQEFNVIVLVNGKEEEVSKAKIQASQYWFFGYEMTDLLLILTQGSITVVGGAQKIKMLEHFKNNKKFKINLVVKDNANNKEHLNNIHATLQKEVGSDLTFGILLKEQQKGGIASEFEDFSKEKNFQLVDMTALLVETLAVKVGEEIEFVKKSGDVVAYMEKLLISDIEKIIEDEQKTKHKEISKKIEAALQDPKQQADLEKKFKVDPGLIDFAYSPIVQSGGTYDLKPQAESNNDVLKYDTIILSVGISYASYNSNIIRTLFIDPAPEQKENYNKINDIMNFITSELKPEKSIQSVYDQAIKKVSEDAELKDKIPLNFGTGIGLEFREMNLCINGKNEKNVEEGMVFNVILAFDGLTTKQDQQNYAIMIADTVIIRKNGIPNDIITSKISRQYQDVSYELDEENEKENEKSNKKDLDDDFSKVDGYNTRHKRKNANKPNAEQNDNKRKEHQQLLKAKKLQELRERLQNNGFESVKKAVKAISLENCNSYRNKDDIPENLKQNQIYVDEKRLSLLLPINGMLIPFHINTVKSVSQQDEGKTDSLRINFHIIGASQSSANIAFPKINNQTVFIKELQFRSKNKKLLEENHKKIKELKKKATEINNEIKNKEDQDEQEQLIVSKGKQPVLRDLQVRPVLSAKQNNGSLECHTNGFRYVTNKNETIDVAFQNIQHAFFQPCDGQYIIAIHFHLKTPITINKKKTYDVQFYTESGLPPEDLNHRRRAGNIDESEEEEMERAQRKKLIKEFEAWIKVVMEMVNAEGEQLSFQTPYRELGFYGSPHRSNCLLQPTPSCLMNIIENPFFVVTLDEVEIACFERMLNGLKNFDLVFVYKDYHQPVTRITAIPKQHLDSMKGWLDKMNIIFFESTRNFMWSNILKTINESVRGFIEDGGWNILLGDDDDTENEDLISGDDEFEPSDDEDESFDSEDDDEEFGGEEGSEFSGGDDDDEDEVVDWDEEQEQDSESDDKRKKKQR